MQNDHGQGMSHASGDSAVPGKIQEKAPEGLERALPESVHPTGDKSSSGGSGGGSGGVSHAKGGGAASIVPQKLQEILPEKVERAVPNALHDTGDKGGVHRS